MLKCGIRGGCNKDAVYMAERGFICFPVCEEHAKERAIHILRKLTEKQCEEKNLYPD